MINNRQAGRRRGRGGQQQRSQGNNPGRGQDTGNRIDNRSRGNAAQLLEKYKSLARDSQMQGDRVNTEYYLQFADHYFRVLAETRSRFEENRTPQQGGANTYQDDEQDYDDDGEPIARAEQPRGNEGGREGGRDGNRNGGHRDENRANGQGNGSQGNGGQSNGHQQNGQYEDDRPQRRNGSNGNGSNGENRYARDDRATQEGGNRPSYSQDENERAPAPVRQESAPQEDRPRRGRPRREEPQEEPAGFEADRLPPSLSISAVSEEPEEKPRRRRVRPAAADVPSASDT